MSAGLENKSVPELLDTAIDVIKKYRTLFDKILGSTPEEIQETHEVLEGFNSAEIREALKLYRRGHPK